MIRPSLAGFEVTGDILTIDGQKENALLHLVTQCSRMLSYLLDHDIPIRGAIAHGQYLRVPSPNGVFVAGKAIIEAYKYEILQDWIGIILAPSIHNFGPDFFSLCEIPQLIGSGSRPPQANARWASCLQHCREIQFHASGSDGRSLYEGFAIVPFDGVLTGENMLASLQAASLKLGRGFASFDVGEARELKVAAGDWLLLQANHGKEFINGERVQVREIQNGRIALADGRSLPAGFNTFTHGYAVTS